MLSAFRSCYRLVRPHADLHIAGALSALSYGYLSLKSSDYGAASVTDLLFVSAIGFALCIFCWQRYKPSLSQRSFPVVAMLLWATVFRLIGTQSFPVLEDDIFRFLWDGYRTVVSGSPYGAAPADFFAEALADERFEAILSSINYPDIKTIYWPMTQWVFALSYLIAPAETWPLQVLLALFDLGVVVLLLRLAAARYVLLYAWSPLIIKEIAFTAHPDVIGVFFLLLAIVLMRRHYLMMAICIGLALAAKPFAIIVAPFILSLNWRAWLAAIVTFIMVGLPFAGDVLSSVEGLQAMNQQWLFNAPVYLLAAIVGAEFSVVSFTFINTACLIVFATLWFIYFLSVTKPWQFGAFSNPCSVHRVPRADYLFALFFLALPVLNPWYLVWLLPFAVIYPTLWTWVASACLLLSYLTGLNTGIGGLGAYDIPLPVMLIEYSLIVLAALVDWRNNSMRREMLSEGQA
ncbi:MAG: hypothetical protein AB8B86_08465 [Pseudomonadales bacterium]